MHQVRFRMLLLAILTVILGAASSASASDVRFKSGRSALKIPFKLYNNHIYVHVSVNGAAPLWFVLDTGAPNIIAAKHARALGLKLTPVGPAQGVGEGEVDAFFAKDTSVTLPGVTVTGQRLGVIAMDNLEVCSNEIDVDPQGNIARRSQPRTGADRQPFDGILGETFLRLFVVELDYASQMMNLYEPKSYKYTGPGVAIPLDVRSQYIFMRAPIKSSKAGTLDATFLIDTGFMSALVMNTPFTEKKRLMPPDEETKPYEICGIGGGAKSRIGTLESVRLGSVDVNAPVTLFSQAGQGNLSREDFDGMIGNALLRRFKVVLDYSRSRMILESAQKK